MSVIENRHRVAVGYADDLACDSLSEQYRTLEEKEQRQKSKRYVTWSD